MKKLIILFVTIAASFATFAQTGIDTMSKYKTDTLVQAKYTCPMHPDQTSDKPGTCPKCGTVLVLSQNLSKKEQFKKQEVKIKNEATVYVCPMHPDQTSDKPGKCAKCGTDMVLSQNLSKKEQFKSEEVKIKNEASVYTCSMHPEVTSNKPGKCPKCGMDLVVKKTITNKTDTMKMK